MYTRDNSGILPKPEADSDVVAHNRIDYHTHAGFHKLLNRERLANYYKRWSASFVDRLRLLNISNKWTEIPDIMDFWMPPLTSSLNQALAGPILEQINPNFTYYFLEYFPYVHDLMKGLPRVLCNRGYALRDSLIQDVKLWHKIARIGFKEADVDEDGDFDPWWGSECIRERQKVLHKVENWDDDAIASSDFGLLWGQVDFLGCYKAILMTLYLRLLVVLVSMCTQRLCGPSLKSFEIKMCCLGYVQSFRAQASRASQPIRILINSWDFLFFSPSMRRSYASGSMCSPFSRATERTLESTSGAFRGIVYFWFPLEQHTKMRISGTPRMESTLSIDSGQIASFYTPTILRVVHARRQL